MAALLDAPRILAKFLPNFDARLQAAPACPGPLCLSLFVDDAPAVHVILNHGLTTVVRRAADIPPTIPVRNVRLGGGTLAQLLLGVTDPGDILEETPAWADPAARAALEVLFPPLWPTWPPADPY
ncbi:MAG: hypothetical protein Q6373_020275 [Candidatus Sigynarchaeota archaeon]